MFIHHYASQIDQIIKSTLNFALWLFFIKLLVKKAVREEGGRGDICHNSLGLANANNLVRQEDGGSVDR